MRPAILSLVILALAGSTSHAQLSNTYINTFDTPSSAASWIFWYGLGYGNSPVTWDGTMDARANTNSGSLMVYLPFGTNGDQAVWFGTFDNFYPYDSSVTANGMLYSNITVDVHVAPGTPLSPSGDFGTLEMGLTDGTGGGTFYFGGQTIPASATNGWVHLVQPIDQSASNITNVWGIDFRYTSYSGYPTNPITFWLDNVTVNLAPATTPTMAGLLKPTLGLNLFSTPANGDQFQRVSARLVNTTGNGWLGATNPVTYSVTITNYPAATYSNYQTQVFIVTGNPPVYETAPDYNETNLVFLDIRDNGDGTAIAAFRYKINLPFDENVYGPDNLSEGTLATLTAPSILGTWSMTFNTDSTVTLTVPGSSTNFPLSATAAAQFVDPLNVYVGSQPNNVANIGQDVVLGAFSITGNATPVSDNFTQDSSLNTGTWQPIAGDPTTVQLVPTGSAWWVKWTVPDTGWSLQTTNELPSVATTNWTTLTGPYSALGLFPSSLVGGYRMVLLPWSSLDATDVGFFRLIQDH